MPSKKQENLECFFKCIPSFIEGDNNVTLIQSLQFSKLKIITGLILLNVFFLLIVYWSLRMRKYLLFTTCSLTASTYFWVESMDGSYQICKKITANIKRANDFPCFEAIAFRHKKLIYHFDYSKRIFKVLELDIQIVFSDILKKYGAGLTEDLYMDYKQIYGQCVIDIKIPNTFELFIREILSPINFLQIICLILWFTNDYFIYAAFVFFLSICSAILNLSIIKANLQNLRAMSSYENEVEVIRVANYQKERIKIKSKDLVPGDVIVLRSGLALPCDCIILNNHAVVNEVNMTGEAIPKIKPGINYCDKVYSIYDKNNTLFDGTLVAQVKNDNEKDTLALVIRTGFYTVKGELFRNIIYSTQKRLELLLKQIIKYVAIMSLLAIIGNSINLGQKNNWENKTKIAKNYLDLFTVAIAPALPTCVFIGIYFSIRTLKKKNLSCYSPYRLLIAGSIDYLFLDKTGTLTEKDLFLKSILISYKQKFQETLESSQEEELKLNTYDNISTVDFKEAFQEILNLTSCCHNIVEVQNDGKNELMGDNIDIKMFEFSKGSIHFFKENMEDEDRIIPNSLFKINSVYKKSIERFKSTKKNLQENKPNHVEIEIDDKNEESNMELMSMDRGGEKILHKNDTKNEVYDEQEIHTIKIFQFNSELQRMSILSFEKKTKSLKCYVKGSPEAIKELCLPDTIPAEYTQKLLELTLNGYVVLSIAYKILDFGGNFQISVVERKNCESNLIFLGFLIYENSLKSDTLENFKLINSCGIEPKILTGDSSTTTLVIAEKLGLVTNLHNTVLIDYMDTNLIVQRDLFEMEKVNKREFSTFHVNMEKENYKNYERLFLMKAISPDHQNYMFLTQTPNLSNSPRKQIFSASTPFVTQFFIYLKRIITCDIVITGKAFQYLYFQRFETFTLKEQKILYFLLKKTIIFSRMLPLDKANLIKIYQKLGFLVGMVGDGLNDAAALKQADVGLALSKSNSNLSASFSTKRTSLNCFIDLLNEGRKTVSNIKHTFKYFALYSLIQFTNVNILSYFESGLTNMQFLTEDLFLATFLVLASSLTACSPTLSKDKPLFDIFSVSNIFSIIGLGLIQLGAQIGVVSYIRSQDWFKSERNLESLLYDYDAYTQETKGVFLFSIILLINCILITGNFSPDRQPFYKNYIFLFSFVGLNIYANIGVLYEPARFSLFDTTTQLEFPEKDILVIWGMSWGTTLILYLWEKLVCGKLISFLVKKAESLKDEVHDFWDEGYRQGKSFEDMYNSTIGGKKEKKTKKRIGSFTKP